MAASRTGTGGADVEPWAHTQAGGAPNGPFASLAGTLQAVLLGPAAEQFFSKLPAYDFAKAERQPPPDSEAEQDAAGGPRDGRAKRRRLEQLQRDNDAALQRLQAVVRACFGDGSRITEAGGFLSLAVVPPMASGR